MYRAGRFEGLVDVKGLTVNQIDLFGSCEGVKRIPMMYVGACCSLWTNRFDTRRRSRVVDFEMSTKLQIGCISRSYCCLV